MCAATGAFIVALKRLRNAQWVAVHRSGIMAISGAKHTHQFINFFVDRMMMRKKNNTVDRNKNINTKYTPVRQHTRIQTERSKHMR